MIYMNVRDALKELFVDLEAEWVELKVTDYDEYLGIARGYDDALCKFSKYLDIEAIDYYHQSHYGFLMIINDKQYFDLLWKEEHNKDKDDKQVKIVDVNTSKPSLDERIIDGKRPLCGFDFEESKKYIGTNGYFGNEVSDFSHINILKYDTLRHVNSYDGSFTNQPNGSSLSLSFKFFLPESFVKSLEEFYRAYSLKEFMEEHGTRSSIKVRSKRFKTEHTLIFLTGTYNIEEFDTPGQGELLCSSPDLPRDFGDFSKSLQWLFEHFEMFKDDGWRPFGVKVETKDE